ncbi:MAG: hypothetical protein KAJ39_09380 [Gammaproteobacteria bacterium]|nr:hypothetical protein [Gammaproteobacteria bacterium]
MTNTTLEGLFDIDSPMDIIVNLYDITQALTGGMFIYIFLPLPFIASLLISKKVLLPTVLYMVVGAPLMIVAPWEYKQPFILMVVIAAAGIIYTWFKERS